MRFKFIISAVLLFFCLSALSSTEISYSELKTKAERFFDNKEWASAEAMYQLMNEQRPSIASDYASGIVAAGMRGDSVAQLRFFDKALTKHIPFDSLFNIVEKRSFSIGSTSLYERFLLMVPNHYAWLRRNVEARLMKYYAFRRDGDGVVEYAKVMLKGLPGDVGFTMLLGEGYMQLGDYNKAMECFQHIVEKDPDNFDALVYLGLFYADNGQTDRGRGYLERAMEVNPTPYLEKRLSEL